MTDPRDGSARSVQARLARHARDIGVGRSLPETIAEVRAFLREPLKLARERMEDRR